MSLKAWFELRKNAIHERVSSHDVLRDNGVKLVYAGEREEQFSCPFHGKDSKPSARVFPSTPQSPSHAWCYVCRERWDVITLWQKYHGTEGFHKTLSAIERHYNIPTPPVPDGPLEYTSDNTSKDRFKELYEVCESRLRSERSAYDLKSYLLMGSFLDKALSQVNSGKLSYGEGIELMTKLRAAIIQKVASSVSSNQTVH